MRFSWGTRTSGGSGIRPRRPGVEVPPDAVARRAEELRPVRCEDERQTGERDNGQGEETGWQLRETEVGEGQRSSFRKRDDAKGTSIFRDPAYKTPSIASVVARNHPCLQACEGREQTYNAL